MILSKTISRSTTLAALLGLGSVTTAAPIDIGDFRLPENTYASLTYFDPSSPAATTRVIAGAPVQVNSTFVAVSQNAGNPPAATDDSDLGLVTSTASTTIRNLSRFTANLGTPETAAFPSKVGAVQWSFNLTPLDSYLSSNSLALTALDLRLVLDASANAEDKKYDVYLSYTNPAESISLADIATDATAADTNYNNFFWPARSTAVDSVANGTHKVIKLDQIGDMDLTLDLRALYNAGIKDFNLIVVAGDYMKGREHAVLSGSGLSIDTQSLPEPASAMLLAVGCGLLCCKPARTTGR